MEHDLKQQIIDRLDGYLEYLYEDLEQNKLLMSYARYVTICEQIKSEIDAVELLKEKLKTDI